MYYSKNHIFPKTLHKSPGIFLGPVFVKIESMFGGKN